MASLGEFALYFLVSLFSCFGPCFHVIMELIDSEEELFLTENFFRKKYWNLILTWEGQTDPLKTLGDRRMIAIVDDEELVKNKGISNTANDTRINTSWAVRVWFESAEERA